MHSIEDILVSQNDTIKDVLYILDTSLKKVVLVITQEKKLLGTINDGDIRRGLLKGLSINDSIETIYCRNPITANINDSKDLIKSIAKNNNIVYIPIVDNDNKIIGLDRLDYFSKNVKKSNKVMLMVGGLGTRLRPLTDDTPKPMLKVGGKPILQTIVEKFQSYGFIDIVMCVNYKSHIIQDYFGDGSSFGVKIEYILEDQRMGTAGALSLLKEKPTEPFFVMNGDLLTNINFEHLLDYHIENSAKATMCIREYHFEVPYGVINLNENKITSIEEKPTHKFFVNTGIYMLDPDVLNFIPNNEFFDMPSLFELLINKEYNIVSFLVREYWLDIGRIEEYEKANKEYFEVFYE